MSISSVGAQNAAQLNMLRMGELLKNITAKQMGIENKLIKMAITEKVTNTGHNIDILA